MADVLFSASSASRVLLVLVLMAMLLQAKSERVGVLGGSLDEDVEYRLLIISRSDNPVNMRVTFFDEGENTTESIVTVSPNMVSEVTMPINSTTMTGTKIAKKGAEVESFGEKVNLRVLVTRNKYTEGFKPLSKSMLGLEYYVSTFCEFGGVCQFSISALNSSQTKVYFKIPKTVNEIVFCVDKTKVRVSDSVSITLRSNEVLLVESPHDLTGTHIVTDRDVVVLAGSRDMNVSGVLSHVVEQLLPVEQWGTNFIFSSMDINQYGDIMQITSSSYNTEIEMGGFPLVEMPVPGLTIKRRIQYGMTSTIASNHPIQVIQVSGMSSISAVSGVTSTVSPGVSSMISPAATESLIVAPGMSVVPATEHFRSKYFTTCGSDKTFMSAKMHSSGTIIIDRFADSTLNLLESSATSVPYSSYSHYSTSSIEIEHVSKISSDYNFNGLMRCEASGILMPVGFSKIEIITDFVTSLASPIYNDGADNDCDGQVDEDYCFENKKVTTHYSIHSSSAFDFYTENITDASLIKLRVKTCGTAFVQLRNDDTDVIYLLHLSRTFIVVYSCLPNCQQSATVNVRGYYQHSSNCLDDISFYWIRITEDAVCADIGPFPGGNCSLARMAMDLASNLTVMKVGGLMQGATIWIDIDRLDCGSLESDWRCTDAITNCHVYGTGLCSNPNYEAWVNQNCRKYCGICTPDGHGRKFIVTNPYGAAETLITVRNATADTFQDVAHSSPNLLLHRENAVTDSDGRLYELTLKLDSSQELAVIVTDVDAVVTVLYRESQSLERTFVAYPVDTYGIEYPVNIPGDDGYCDIIATEDTTVVKIAQQNGPTVQETLEPGNKTTKQVYMSDGVVFKANRPFAVFCGDHISGWNQMFPQFSLGKHHIIPALNSYGALQMEEAMVIVATQGNTVVKSDLFDDVVLEKRGDHTRITFESTEVHNITSSKPVSVGLFGEETSIGKSAFILLAAVDNFMDYPLAFEGVDRFLVYVDSAGNGDMLYSTSDTADNKILQKQTFVLTVFLGNSDWEGGTSIMLYHTPSLQFSNLKQEYMCRVTESAVGDNIDNDCDGLTDEEICYPDYGAIREDKDLDGGYGEDCYTEVTGTSKVKPPSEPRCGDAPVMPEVERPEEECWASCQCDCEWVRQLEYRLSLTPEELDALNEAIVQEYQEDMKIEKKQLASEIAKKQSAGDERTSSTTIGSTGIVFLALVLLLVVAVDAVTLFSYLCGRPINQY